MVCVLFIENFRIKANHSSAESLNQSDSLLYKTFAKNTG